MSPTVYSGGIQQLWQAYRATMLRMQAGSLGQRALEAQKRQQGFQNQQGDLRMTRNLLITWDPDNHVVEDPTSCNLADSSDLKCGYLRDHQERTQKTWTWQSAASPWDGTGDWTDHHRAD